MVGVLRLFASPFAPPNALWSVCCVWLRIVAKASLTCNALLLGLSPQRCLQKDLQRHLFYWNLAQIAPTFANTLRWANRHALG